MRILRLIVLIMLAQPAAFAQGDAGATTPKFEVISVKLNKAADARKALLQLLPGGRFVATNIPLIQVIALAWNLPLESQRLTLGAGVKMPDDIYDIEAGAPEGAFPPGMMQDARLAKMRLMLQSLLEERFKLSVRREPKEEPVYVLVVAKDGPKLEKSQFQEQHCGDTSAKWMSNPACHFLSGGQDSGLHGGSVTIAQVVESVQNYTDRPVFDKTGLSDYYDVETGPWAPMRPSLDGASQHGDASISNSDRPTLFDVFEKLGLRLESQRAVIDVFTIEHVERPSEN
jgi:uncharacterized protein (TIGR03435 family)